MTRTQTIEGAAATLAIILLLFSPMLDPLVSLVLAIMLILILLVAASRIGPEGTARS